MNPMPPADPDPEDDPKGGFPFPFVLVFLLLLIGWGITWVFGIFDRLGPIMSAVFVLGEIFVVIVLWFTIGKKNMNQRR